MKHSIETTGTGLRVSAQVDADKQAALLEELGKCASGHCACPTPQYDKLKAIEVRSQEGQVSVELKSRPGEQIDAADIERCLDHTARQIGA